MKKAKLDELDVEELACFVCGLDYDEIDADTDVIEDNLIVEFGCDLTQFTELMRILLPMVDVQKSQISERIYRGFADESKCMWLLKSDVSF
jgi:hypothetical protein